MKLKLKYSKPIKVLTLMFLLGVFFSSIAQKTTYARYVSQFDSESEVGVVKFGTLNLVEKVNGEVQDNKTSSLDINTDLVLGQNIDKEVYLEILELAFQVI